MRALDNLKVPPVCLLDADKHYEGFPAIVVYSKSVTFSLGIPFINFQCWRCWRSVKLCKFASCGDLQNNSAGNFNWKFALCRFEHWISSVYVWTFSRTRTVGTWHSWFGWGETTQAHPGDFAWTGELTWDNLCTYRKWVHCPFRCGSANAKLHFALFEAGMFCVASCLV